MSKKANTSPTAISGDQPPVVCVDRYVPAAYFIEVVENQSWLNQKGKPTTHFERRGLWDTAQEAETARIHWLTSIR